MAVFPKLINRFNARQSPSFCFTENDELILKSTWNGKGSRLAKTILKKKKKLKTHNA